MDWTKRSEPTVTRLDTLTLGGLAHLSQVHREAGEFADYEEVLSQLDALNALNPHPYVRMVQVATQATSHYLAGDLAAAETTIEQLLSLGREGDLDPFNLYAAHLLTIRSQQGRIVELLPLIEKAVKSQPGHRPYATAVLFSALARAGRSDEATDVLNTLAEHDYDMPHNMNWFVGTVELADGVEILDNTTVAGLIRERLTPFAERIADFAAGVSRPADQALAQLALTLTDPEGAEAAAIRAVEASRRRRTPIFLGRELVLLAAARQRSGQASDDLASLIAEAAEIADATGAQLINQEITRYRLLPPTSRNPQQGTET
jgi:tetratricopeptide (TPR) repeat protein